MIKKKNLVRRVNFTVNVRNFCHFFFNILFRILLGLSHMLVVNSYLLLGTSEKLFEKYRVSFDFFFLLVNIYF